MIPTIGRIVLFNLPAEYWQYVGEQYRVRPAIVTRVVTGRVTSAINLRVIYDPTDQFMVSVFDQTGVFEDAGSAGCWFWPPREEAGS